MKDRLKEYIEKDEIYQAYKNGKLTNINDFDKFCIQHCKDIDELIKENKELKSQLEEANKKLYLCTPEIPQNVHGEYVSYVDLVNEIYELKKQLEVGEQQYNDLVEEKEKLEEQLSSITLELEEYKNQVNKGLYNTWLPYKTGYDKAVEDYKTQQQEFIKYLEDEINKTDYEVNILGNYPYLAWSNACKKNLQKYKEITGVLNE